ncbi:hypothetical protein AAFF_G00349160 [Aldrovandia affinis]|uniref:Uncharacterized protein n=1 Tax=Aldrovandia affinis TaxID=143900 RepID=A0AAD7WNW0_9TELE|nr:hypothetical protein AAFF_G00349160 [Aldrovandia affinis]
MRIKISRPHVNCFLDAKEFMMMTGTALAQYCPYVAPGQEPGHRRAPHTDQSGATPYKQPLQLARALRRQSRPSHATPPSVCRRWRGRSFGLLGTRAYRDEPRDSLGGNEWLRNNMVQIQNLLSSGADI